MPIRSLQCRRWLAQRLGLSLSTLERQRTCCEHNPPPHVVIGWHAGTPRRQAAACGEARCHPCLVLLLHRRGVDASQGPSPRRPIEAIHRVRRRRERGLGLDCVPRGFGSSLIEPYPLRPDIDQTTKKPTRGGWLFLFQINDLPESDVERAMGIEPTASAWEAEVLPLYDARSESRDCTQSGGGGQPGCVVNSRPTCFYWRCHVFCCDLFRVGFADDQR